MDMASADTKRIRDFETIDKGTNSYYDKHDRSQLIEIYNYDDWSKFWADHKHLKVPKLPPGMTNEPLPEVNFDEFYVLVALDQLRGSGGYLVEIKEIETNPKYGNRPVTIFVVSQQPGDITGTISLMTRPYHIIKARK
jgi:hypothetical protein